MRYVLQVLVLGLPFVLVMLAGPLVLAGQVVSDRDMDAGFDVVLVLTLSPDAAKQQVVRAGGALVGPVEAPLGFLAQLDPAAAKDLRLWALPADKLAELCGFNPQAKALESAQKSDG